ncbi:hypothetical protein ILYODFUR_030662 [Ilyodon furcidens]|uniref:EF-hand domain-containing protein n=1 Tax=Ilyodon furcidens TaxID=33524 RepID=A0ABV0U1Y9_9TELE
MQDLLRYDDYNNDGHLSLQEFYTAFRRGDNRSRREPSLQRHPPTHSGGSQGVSRPVGIHSPSSKFWVIPWVSSKRNMPSILIRCPNHLS